MLNGITSFNNFESEISMNSMKLFASPMIDWSLALWVIFIGTLSHTYHTATYTVGCGSERKGTS